MVPVIITAVVGSALCLIFFESYKDHEDKYYNLRVSVLSEIQERKQLTQGHLDR